MNAFLSAFWAEVLKAYRSKVSRGTFLGFLILPIIDGLFMIILKNPEQARAMGLIGVKAQLAGGVADWSTFSSVLLQGNAIGGALLFTFITAWVFGREFSDHTAKEILAIPTPRQVIIGAKFLLTLLWISGLTLMIFVIGLAIGAIVDIPGWSLNLTWTTLWTLLLTSLLNFMLMPFVAFFASAGRGYLPPLGWSLSTLALAQIAGILGWGDRFPWSIPALVSGMLGPHAELLGIHSYILIFLTFTLGGVATFMWWLHADHTR